MSAPGTRNRKSRVFQPQHLSIFHTVHPNVQDGDGGRVSDSSGNGSRRVGTGGGRGATTERDGGGGGGGSPRARDTKCQKKGGGRSFRAWKVFGRDEFDPEGSLGVTSHLEGHLYHGTVQNVNWQEAGRAINDMNVAYKQQQRRQGVDDVGIYTYSKTHGLSSESRVDADQLFASPGLAWLGERLGEQRWVLQSARVMPRLACGSFEWHLDTFSSEDQVRGVLTIHASPGQLPAKLRFEVLKPGYETQPERGERVIGPDGISTRDYEKTHGSLILKDKVAAGAKSRCVHAVEAAKGGGGGRTVTIVFDARPGQQASTLEELHTGLLQGDAQTPAGGGGYAESLVVPAADEVPRSTASQTATDDNNSIVTCPTTGRKRKKAAVKGGWCDAVVVVSAESCAADPSNEMLQF